MGVKDITFLGFLDDGSSPHWSEMTASCMLGLDEDSRVVETGSLGGGPEVSAACIHLGVRRARPDLRAVFHLHPPYSTALACTRDPTVLQGPDSKGIIFNFKFSLNSNSRFGLRYPTLRKIS